MFCIWWDQTGLVYYELLKLGDSITDDRLQLIRLSRALREKRSEYEQRCDKVILLHVAKVVKQYLETLKWDILPHSPYSPDIAPSDYWLFQRNSKSSVHFFRRNRKLAPKLDRLQRRIIFSRFWKLSERWEKIVGGQYFNWSVHSFCFEINA